MAIILNIDTAVETASVSLGKDGLMIGMAKNESQKDHASWIQGAVKGIMMEAGMKMGDLEAVAVTFGPGSYTGLRVGLATAKGLCYSLSIPLIGINTLVMMAHAVRDTSARWICPMIDARRMEVFTAVYDKSLLEIVKPSAVVIDENFFSSFLESDSVLFSGNGAKKLKEILLHGNALFSNAMGSAANLIDLSLQKFNKKDFADLAYAEPFYLKEFYSPTH